MRKMKRFVAATLAMTMLFATSVMAQTPREVLDQAAANYALVETMAIRGTITGTVELAGMELLQLDMGMDMLVDVDMDAESMMMYIRMPMTITGVDPVTNEALNETLEVAVFMDGANVFVYESTIGWFTDDSMDMGDVDMMWGDMEELMEWAMGLENMILDMWTLEFVDAPAGLYAIETVLGMDDLFAMVDAMLSPEFLEGIFAFMPYEDLVLIEAELAELDGLMDELMQNWKNCLAIQKLILT